MERLGLSFTGFSGKIKLHFVVNNREKDVLIAKILPELLGAKRLLFTIAPHFSSSGCSSGLFKAHFYSSIISSQTFIISESVFLHANSGSTC